MNDRELTVIEIREVLRLWLKGGEGLRPIADVVGGLGADGIQVQGTPGSSTTSM